MYYIYPSNSLLEKKTLKKLFLNDFLQHFTNFTPSKNFFFVKNRVLEQKEIIEMWSVGNRQNDQKLQKPKVQAKLKSIHTLSAIIAQKVV